MKKFFNTLWLIAIIATIAMDIIILISTPYFTAETLRAVMLLNLAVVLIGEEGEKK